LKTLQDLLLARFAADPRAHVGAIDVWAGRLRLTFAAVAGQPRVVVAIDGNGVAVLQPDVSAIPAPAEPIEKIVFDDYSKAALIRAANDRGIQVKSGATKAQIAAALNTAAGYGE